MSLSIYIHIPYCIQKCSYCDFATFTMDKMPSFHTYVSHILKEMDYRHHSLKEKTISSVYFGGGTPSLLPASLIEKIISRLKSHFVFEEKCEITLEINPGTLTLQKTKKLMSLGVNRLSIGVQTFSDDLLKFYGREHSAKQSLRDLDMFSALNISFSADILFALKAQNTSLLNKDLDTLLSYQPNHISCYCLTLPANHVLKKSQPKEATQIKMFHLVSSKLKNKGYEHYEISNFAKSSCFSRHNLSYWTDQSYWGLGLSSHSYLKIPTKNGKQMQRVRFWNPKNLKSYFKQVKESPKNTPPASPFEAPFDFLPFEQKEFLAPHEALTDFCHTGLRTKWGISAPDLIRNFGAQWTNQVIKKLHTLQVEKSWIKNVKKDQWVLDPRAYVFCNFVFQELTFLKEDLYSSERGSS